MSLVSPAIADTDQGIYFAPEIGYVLPTDGNVDDSVFLGARVGYEFDCHWALELESGWTRVGYDVSHGGPQNVDVDVIPVLANVRFTGQAGDSNWDWYVFGGMGAAFDSVDGGDAVDVGDSFVWQTGFGADVPIAESTSAFLDVRYQWNQPNLYIDAPLDAQIDDPEHINLHAVMFTTGVKF
jgi:hypothetical protein